MVILGLLDVLSVHAGLIVLQIYISLYFINSKISMITYYLCFQKH